MVQGNAVEQTLVERASARELVVKRVFNAPAAVVFEAWTKPELMRQWWVPASFGITLVSIDMDVRVGGGYRLVFSHPASEEHMAFFGKYTQVKAPTLLAWSNDESPDGAVTTVTFEERDGKTHVVMRDLYPTEQALDAAINSGSTGAPAEQFAMLDHVLAART